MKQKLWAIIAFLYCFMLGITAQQNNQKQIVVSGVVTDANNEPLIGANVTVKNVPGLGAITNIDGKYTIKMQPYNRLVFSYIGYETQEILVKEEHTVNVVMKENKDHCYRCAEEVDSDGCSYYRQCRPVEGVTFG